MESLYPGFMVFRASHNFNYGGAGLQEITCSQRVIHRRDCRGGILTNLLTRDIIADSLHATHHQVLVC